MSRSAHLTFDSLNGALKAAGEETRLRILVLLAEAELTVSDLTQILRQSQPRISRHLKLLVEAGLVERFREGAWAFFRLAEGSGSLENFRTTPQGVLMGKALAERLGLTVGDSLILRAGTEQRRYRLSGIYTTGVRDIDRMRIYMHLGEARSLLKKTTGASFIQVALFDRDRAPQDAQQMEQVLKHGAQSWQEREESWLEAFHALQISAALTVSTIILISGLGMFNTLAMIVIEKTKEIAILRSMGYTRQDIMQIFIWLGTIVLVIGTIGGWIFGYTVTYGVSKYPIRLRGIFSTDSFQVYWSIWHYVVATVTATVVVMTAAIIPARRAARLEPGDIIRGTSQ